MSIEKNNTDLAKKLLELGADPKKKSFAYTPLELAFRYSDEMVFYFFEHFKEYFIKTVSKHPANTALPSDPISLNLVPT